MANAKITGVPNKKVTSLSTPTRDGYKFSSTWKVPSDCVDKKKNKRRFEELLIKWYRWTRVTVEVDDYKTVGTTTTWIKKKGKKKKQKVTTKIQQYVGKKKVTVDKKESQTLETQKKAKETTTSDSVTVNKKNFYPYTTTKLSGISVSVAGINKKNHVKDKKTNTTVIKNETYQNSNELKLEAPSSPAIEDMSLDLETGHLSATVSMFESEKKPCLGMRCWIKRTSSFSTDKDGTHIRKYPATWNSGANWNCMTSTTEMGIDIVDWQTFPVDDNYNGWILIEFYAQAFGMAGARDRHRGIREDHVQSGWRVHNHFLSKEIFR